MARGRERTRKRNATVFRTSDSRTLRPENKGNILGMTIPAAFRAGLVDSLLSLYQSDHLPHHCRHLARYAPIKHRTPHAGAHYPTSPLSAAPDPGLHVPRGQLGHIYHLRHPRDGTAIPGSQKARRDTASSLNAIGTRAYDGCRLLCSPGDALDRCQLQPDEGDADGSPLTRRNPACPPLRRPRHSGKAHVPSSNILASPCSPSPRLRPQRMDKGGPAGASPMCKLQLYLEA